MAIEGADHKTLRHRSRDTVAINETDKRRILLATALTVVALPALWLANQSDSAGAPNVATVGVDVGDAGANGHSSPSRGESYLPRVEGTSEAAPVFLGDPDYVVSVGIADVATPPTVDHQSTKAMATYRSSIGNIDWCIAPGIAARTQLTIVNLDNNQSTTCVTIAAPDGAEQLVMHTQRFSYLADVTEAPIPVEIQQ